MVILGLILVLATAGLTVYVAFQNPSSVGVHALGQTVTVSLGWLFVAGVITAAVGLLGLSLLLSSMGRARRRRATLAESRATSRDLKDDRDRLAGQLDRERAGHTQTPPAPLPGNDAAGGENGPGVVDSGRRTRPVGSAPTENAALADTDEREPVAAGRHGLLHRRDH